MPQENNPGIKLFKHTFIHEVMDTYYQCQANISNQPGLIASLFKMVQSSAQEAIVNASKTAVSELSKTIGGVAGNQQTGENVGGAISGVITASSLIYGYVKDKKKDKKLKEAKNFIKNLSTLGEEKFVQEMADQLIDRFLFVIQELYSAKHSADIKELALFFTAVFANVLIGDAIVKSRDNILPDMIYNADSDLFKKMWRNKKLDYEQWTFDGLLHRSPLCTLAGELWLKNDKDEHSDKYPPQRVINTEPERQGYRSGRPSLKNSSFTPAQSDSPYVIIQLKLHDIKANDKTHVYLQTCKNNLAAFMSDHHNEYKFDIKANKICKETAKRSELINIIDQYNNNIKQEKLHKDLAQKLYYYACHLLQYANFYYLLKDNFIPDVTETLYFVNEIEWLTYIVTYIASTLLQGKEIDPKLSSIIEKLKDIKQYLLIQYDLSFPQPIEFKEMVQLKEDKKAIEAYKAEFIRLEEMRQNAIHLIDKSKSQELQQWKSNLYQLLPTIESCISTASKRSKELSNELNESIESINHQLRIIIKEIFFCYIACGDQQKLQSLMSQYNFLQPDTKLHQRCFTALHEAAVWGYLEVFEFLLNKAQERDIILAKLLAEYNQDEFITADDKKRLKENDGSTVLHSAVFGGNIAVVEKLLKEGIDVNCVNHVTSGGNVGFTPLHNAALAVNPEKVKVMEILIRNDADVNMQSNKKGILSLTPLHVIFQNERLYNECLAANREAIRLLLKKGANVNIQDHEGNTPLHFAARMQELDDEMIKLLIEKGASLLIKSKNGKTSADELRATFEKIAKKLSQTEPDSLEQQHYLKKVDKVKQLMVVVEKAEQDEKKSQAIKEKPDNRNETKTLLSNRYLWTLGIGIAAVGVTAVAVKNKDSLVEVISDCKVS